MKSKKKMGGNHAFFKNSSWIISVESFKIQSNVNGVLSQIEA